MEEEGTSPRRQRRRLRSGPDGLYEERLSQTSAGTKAGTLLDPLLGTPNESPFEYPGYTYRPLAPNSIRTFRLLPLQPGKSPHSQPVSCTFDSGEVNFYDNVIRAYAAVSFEWGDPHDRGEVIIAGWALPVPRNLEVALRAIRDPEDSKTLASLRLWADAVCINQDDINEKKVQIQMMGLIFQKAHPLLVWVGSGDYVDHMAIQAAARISGPFAHDGSASLVNHPDPRYAAPDFFDPHFRALRSFLRRTYFGRSWIIQEIVQPLTEDIRIMCGRQTITWQRMRLAIQLIRSHDWEDQPACGWLKELELPIDKTRERFRAIQMSPAGNKDGCSLSDNLFAFREYRCTYPEDKIWSIRSLCTDLRTDELLPRAGEHMAVGDVFCAATSIALRWCRSLDILSLCRQHDTEVQRPSWVPDYWSFAQHPVVELLAARDSFVSKARYSASGTSEAEVALGENGSLTVRGKVLGQLSAILKRPDIVGPCPRDVVVPLQWTTLYCQCLDMLPPDKRIRQLWEFAARSWPRQPKGAEDEQSARAGELWQYCRDMVANPFSNHEPYVTTWNDFISWQRVQEGRAMAVMNDKLLVQVPLDSRIGDQVVLIKGARVPFVRRLDEQARGSSKLIGECRLEGHMDGEMWPVYENQLEDLVFVYFR